MDQGTRLAKNPCGEKSHVKYEKSPELYALSEEAHLG